MSSNLKSRQMTKMLEKSWSPVSTRVYCICGTEKKFEAKLLNCSNSKKVSAPRYLVSLNSSAHEIRRQVRMNDGSSSILLRTVHNKGFQIVIRQFCPTIIRLELWSSYRIIPVSGGSWRRYLKFYFILCRSISWSCILELKESNENSWWKNFIIYCFL